MAIGERRVLELPARRKTPWVAGALLAACVGIFLAGGAGLLPAAEDGLPWGALYGPAVSAGGWYRVLAHSLVHANALHIVLNMSVVWSLGFSLERLLGSGPFALASIATTLGAAALALAFSYDGSTVGASGMIVGWIGVLLPISNRQSRRSLIQWLIQIAVISIVPNLIPGSPVRVSWQGHLGGFLAGLPCGYLLRDRARFLRLSPLVITLAAAAAWLGALYGAATDVG